ncbi:2-keto-4-pentenoate hydratase [Wenjunlia vitaminophila]|uniref:2-keto-4-pentenoate hydratase n=1 Tax=Wenjunlia vitaminophila TaxID=76728 RepID=A0A0T6LP35_WENVI|nr:2-keto-4-pentenoate hydratase [Wenjunlia vitaminophila]KRV47870.1 2-keto-4-pentenoate hydratase [Wenjunlia vitaminophila]
MTATEPTDPVRAAAEALARAAETGVPCSPVRDRFAPADVAAAYAVQRVNVQRRVARGHRVVGRKIGLTSPAVQRQLGVDQPDYGALLSDMAVLDGGVVPGGRLLQPKVEAEVALVLGADLPHRGTTAADVLRAVEFALPALEVVDSRIADWDISLVDTVADNASSGLFVLGGTPVPLTSIDLRDVRMTLDRNGDLVSRGSGRDCLGSPLNAAVWLASTLAAVGDPLRAGDVVLTGALGPMAAASPGDAFEAHIDGLGSVRVGFAPHATDDQDQGGRR